VRLRGMIFDMDGTLADTLPVCIAALQHVFYKYLGRHYSAESITAMFGPTEEGMIQRVLPDRWDAALNDYLAEYERLHAERSTAFPGISEALELLRERGVKLGIVTGKGSRSAAISLRYLGLAPYFDVVQAGSAEGAVKPQSLRKVLSRWQMPPQEAAYVGDAPPDMQDAIQVGLVPIAAAWADTSTVRDPAISRAQVTFSSVDEFMHWIEAHL
jgi:pyrophosphatase PpaX